MDTVRSIAGDTLDALAWRARGLGPADLPAILAANPGIAALGPILPTGTPVILPDIAAPASSVRELVQLWS